MDKQQQWPAVRPRVLPLTALFRMANPGNNRGMSGELRQYRHFPPQDSCWTITAAECSLSDMAYKNNLNLSVRMLAMAFRALVPSTFCTLKNAGIIFWSALIADPDPRGYRCRW